MNVTSFHFPGAEKPTANTHRTVCVKRDLPDHAVPPQPWAGPLPLDQISQSPIEPDLPLSSGILGEVIKERQLGIFVVSVFEKDDS